MVKKLISIQRFDRKMKNLVHPQNCARYPFFKYVLISKAKKPMRRNPTINANRQPMSR